VCLSQKKRQTNRALKLGLLFFGIGAGILTGSIVEFLLGLEPPLGIFAMMFIFGGVALVLYYLIEARHTFEDVEEAFIAPRARKIKAEEDAPFETELRMEERKFDEEEGFDLTQRQH